MKLEMGLHVDACTDEFSLCFPLDWTGTIVFAVYMLNMQLNQVPVVPN